ncbi:MAG: TusE/DsrC/DsvC family sulfur relay protein [Desulfocapsaceae bacterium]|jgi:tRNA 2-thiouridine synthesizing protein E|nr:TusE/DsrC/DsvC family sulfur relay protein [Desulfocapsaceae bacterium]
MATKTYNVEVKGKRYLVTEQHQLANGDRWDHDIRDWIAAKLDITMHEEHLSVIDFIRKPYARRSQHPMVRVIAAELARQYGPEKGSLRYFYSLFPKGVHQAVAIAGVPLKGLCF